jgi:Alpha/beta hydrolase domain
LPGNPVDYWWSLRALLVAMDRWVREGDAPPPSTYPRIDRASLVSAANVAFPAIPAVQAPNTLRSAARVPNLLLPGGAGGGTPLPLLVPQVDADGNEVTGIRLPDVAVPLATYTGWNFRRPEIGGTHLLVSLLGSSIPLARTRAEREARRDPRMSIEERYASRSAYLSRIREAADALVRERYLLAEDLEAVMRRSADMWDLLSRIPATARANSVR